MANISLSYKKYHAVPTVMIDTYPSSPADSYAVPVTPNWLIMAVARSPQLDASGNIIRQSYQVTLDPQYADQLAPGTHTATVDLVYFADADPNKPFRGERIRVTLEVIDSVKLTLSKKAYNFSYTIGQPAPATQPLGITSENAWTVVADQPWVTLSQNTGNASLSINLGVNVTGLAVGVHEANFLVDDGNSIEQGTVTLVVTGASDTGDYLNISRTTLSFSEIFQQAPTRTATFSVETSLAATISSLASWLSFSQTALAAGTHEITVSTAATEALALGSYTSKIKIESGYSTRSIDVLLRIVENDTTGIVSGELYFAKDRNTLVLGSSLPNAEALLDITSVASGKTKTYNRRLPFFNNVAEAIIGLETSALLKPENLPLVFGSGAFIPVKPLLMDITVFDKLINSTSVTERQSFAQLRFLNGASPAVENVLSLLPNKITVPKDALICFSFYSEDPISSISVTGDVTDSIVISPMPTYIYSCVVNLANYVLAAGDQVMLSAGPVSVTVHIKPTQLPTTRLVYLNEWDCPEVLNLDGTVELIDEDDSTEVTVYKAGKEISTIMEVKDARSFRVGTGNIYSAAEVKWLAGLLRSRKSWLEIAGERIEVVRTMRSLSVSKTREHSRSFVLNFDAAAR